MLSSLTAQATYRRSEIVNEQATFGSATSISLSSTTDRAVNPSLSLTWVGGVLTSYDASQGRTEQVSAGNLFKTERNQQNATVAFAFRPPVRGRWRSNIRTTLRYSVTENTQCLRSAGQTDCVPFVDSRQVQGQLTMDTELPPNMSAGIQMAYLLNEERQTNRKIRQLVITAFVQLATSVGQLR